MHKERIMIINIEHRKQEYLGRIKRREQHYRHCILSNRGEGTQAHLDYEISINFTFHDHQLFRAAAEL